MEQANRILNMSQAEAVYSAMCALNNVSGVINVLLPTGRIDMYIRVFQEIISDDVVVSVSYGGAVSRHERFVDQNAFAIAYGLE